MNIIAFTGAGMSKAAGIPTFEEVPNLKDKLTVEFKQSNPVEFFDTMETLIDTVKDKEPTNAHKALASLPIPIITMNIDCLHQKAGSRLVLELHGNYRKENIVLYGENIHNAEAVINLILQVSGKARLYNEESIFLVIGTSMQTAFANTLVGIAEKCGMKIHFINENAEEEVPKFIKEHVFLPRKKEE